MRTATLCIALLASAPALAQQKAVDPQVERGRYIVSIAGCNDCHTPDYGMKNGQVEEARWLTGDVLG
jgi:mono/diheme cytochrome c family protein